MAFPSCFKALEMRENHPHSPHPPPKKIAATLETNNGLEETMRNISKEAAEFRRKTLLWRSLMKVGTNAKGAPPLGVVGALSRGPGA